LRDACEGRVEHGISEDEAVGKILALVDQAAE